MLRAEAEAGREGLVSRPACDEGHEARRAAARTAERSFVAGDPARVVSRIVLQSRRRILPVVLRSHLAVARIALGSCLLSSSPSASDDRLPPDPIPQMLETPALPRAVPDPAGRALLLAEPAPPSRIDDLASNAIELAGSWIDPRTNARADARTYSGFVLKQLAHPHVETSLAHPDGLEFGLPIWSPDGLHFASSLVGPHGTELWLGDVDLPGPRRLVGPVLNESFGRACRWMPDSRYLLCRVLVEERDGPRTAAPASFREDLLLRHLASQLALVDAASGSLHRIGPVALIETAAPSPDGSYLLVSRIPDPGSLRVAASAPRITEIWDVAGRAIRRLDGPSLLAGSDLAKRGFRWAAGEPAGVVWAEALPSGEGEATDGARDRLVRLTAPFENRPTEFMRLHGTFSGIDWISPGNRAIVHEYERSGRRIRSWLVRPDAPDELLWDRSADDAYSHPGTPLRVPGSALDGEVASHAGAILLAGAGASAAGARPFLDRLDLTTLESERLWESSPSRHEEVVDLLSAGDLRFLVRHESRSTPPNYAVLELDEASHEPSMRDLTAIDARSLPLRSAERRVLEYERADGVPLAGTLYLPADRVEGERLPLLIWVYPAEHASPQTAAQAARSPHRHADVRGLSPLPLVTQGFAVLIAAMPVVGDSETANDTFVEQIVANARAAIDAAVAAGVGDRQRVAVGGHSYGAFAAVSLLANSDLFAAGVALSGAYNRTLTPFGFQTERRTLWQAPETYLRMSPFLQAHRIKAPLLLVHGEHDDHPGTPPEQSILLYRAVRENGGTARLLLLPREGHRYRAKESTLQVLAEFVAWLDHYLKPEAVGSDPQRVGSPDEDPSG